jgi:hypothetical protein
MANYKTCPVAWDAPQQKFKRVRRTRATRTCAQKSFTENSFYHDTPLIPLPAA